MATVRDIIAQWQQALHIEIRELQEQGGTRYALRAGMCLERTGRGALYSFTMAEDALFPEDAPVRLEYRGETSRGRIVSTVGFHVVLELDMYLGERLAEAALFSEPWELLEALGKQLETAGESLTKQRRIGQLLSGSAPAKHPADKAKHTVHDIFLRSSYNPATFVWGPPGTGKTYTLARVAANHYLKGKRVLVAAHSNAAVDVLLLEIAACLRKQGKWKTGGVLRYGFSVSRDMRETEGLLAASLAASLYPDLAEERRMLEEQRSSRAGNMAETERRLRQLRREIKEAEGELVEVAGVLGVTLSKAALDPLVFAQEFDLVIVDEASMAYVPQIAFAAALGKRVIVCGDFRQLPPIAVSQHPLTERWLKRDIFHSTKVAQSVGGEQVHPHLVTLREQRRMHPAISGFTNEFIYEGQVFDHAGAAAARQPIADMAPFPGAAAALLDVAGMGAYCLQDVSSHSRFNLYSALLGVQLLAAGQKAGIASAGIVTPYKAQARFISGCIQDIFPERTQQFTAATVHKFQGSERDMIVFDSVDSFPQQRAGTLLTGPESRSLLNVAVTRARGKFIQITDQKYIASRVAKGNAVRALSEYMAAQQYVQPLPEVLQQSFTEQLRWYAIDDTGPLLQDLARAKRSLIISMPQPAQVRPEIWRQLQLLQHRISITIITDRQEEVRLQQFLCARLSLVMPFCIVDEELLWTGMPYTIDKQYPSQPLYAARLVSERAVEVLTEFLCIEAAPAVRPAAKPVVSSRPSYTLRQFLASWDQCPHCRSNRRAEVTRQGSIRLSCSYCGGGNGLPAWLLTKYIEHINLQCKSCARPLEAEGSGRDLHVVCRRCEEAISPADLW